VSILLFHTHQNSKMRMKKQKKTLVTHGTIHLSHKHHIDEFLKLYEKEIMHYSIDKHQYYKCKPFLSIVIYTDSVLCKNSFDWLISNYRHL